VGIRKVWTWRSGQLAHSRLWLSSKASMRSGGTDPWREKVGRALTEVSIAWQKSSKSLESAWALRLGFSDKRPVVIALAPLGDDEVSVQIKFPLSRGGQPVIDETVELSGEVLPCEGERAAPGEVAG
jgi:hypothetical protein